MLDFLLEIGTEEIPARFLSDTENELCSRFTKELNEAGIQFHKIETFSTPRRAIVYIHKLSEKQEVKEEIFAGPGEKIAYNEDKTLSKAALGFLKGHNASVSDIFIQETEKGRYIAIKKQVGGLTTKTVLEKICPLIISSLPFPKKMRWNTGSMAYARPVQWILALLNEEIVNFKFANVKSNNLTFGHRVHGHTHILVHKIHDYFKIMEKECVIIKTSARKLWIIDKGTAQAEEIQGNILWKEGLLKEVLGLVEFPIPLIGEFDKSFLELPKEVLLTSMETHQKSFGIADENGKLMPYFLTVLNLHPLHVNVVKKGWERVLRARLEDARFFWKTDLALLHNYGFDHWQDKLEKVTFLGPLGSMGDKALRLEKLCTAFAPQLGLKSEIAARAGKLAKADLVSTMVGEFDTLQGIMGGIYCNILGEKEVAQAIAEQYLPAGPETQVPDSDYGALLSLCDKADTLVGLFGLNNIPTGTADPFALRRCAIGIARILRDKKWNISVLDIFTLAQSFYAINISWKLPKEITLEKLVDFYQARVKNLFLTEGFDPAYVDAVIHLQENSAIYILSLKLQALIDFSQHKDFKTTVQSFKRISNILKKQNKADFASALNVSLFENQAEKDLAKTFSEKNTSITEVYNSGNFYTCFTLLSELCPYIDTFFDSTMIMAEDPALRSNRLTLLNQILFPLTQLADFSALQL